MIGTLLTSILTLLYNVFDLLLKSFVSGIQFFSSTITTIPDLIFDLLDSLPGFFQVGFTGVFGLLLCVVFFKLFQLFKLL